MFLTFTNLLQKVQHFYVCPDIRKICLKDYLACFPFSPFDSLIPPAFHAYFLLSAAVKLASKRYLIIFNIFIFHFSLDKSVHCGII